MLNFKSVLITGGTGSLGQSLTKEILKKYPAIKKITILSRDEYKQYEMKKKFNNNIKKLRFLLGDVRDEARLMRAFSEIDYVFHAAALKQVPAAEYDPFEFIKTNILGAQNVIEASIKNNVKKVIALSTDKAASPINLYGATKLCSDKIFISANNITGKKKIKFSVVRYGNVFGSRGSVIPLFDQQKKSAIFTITDKRMTRFNITLKESIDMILWTLKYGLGGDIIIPKIPSYKITDLAKAINEKNKIKIIGIRIGEKIHEDLLTPSDSLRSIELDKYYIILPGNVKKKKNNFFYEDGFGGIKKLQYPGKFKIVDNNFSYNSFSNKKYLNIKDLKVLFKKYTNGLN